MRGFLCSGKVYEYKGWTFEINYGGPHPLKKDGSPRKTVGKKFYDVYNEFYQLDDKDQYRIGGGCREIST